MRRAKALWIIGFLCACFLLTAGCKAKDDGFYYELEDFEINRSGFVKSGALRFSVSKRTRAFIYISNGRWEMDSC